MNLGLPEMIVIFCVALLFFGPKKLPELAKNLGKGIRDFKKAVAGEDDKEEASPANYTPPTAHLPNTQARVKSEPSSEEIPKKEET